MSTRDAAGARQSLIDKSRQDQALRDLMPVVEWLTNADAAFYNGAIQTFSDSLALAVKAFRDIPSDSPAIDAYIRWLVQKTEEDDAKGRRP